MIISPHSSLYTRCQVCFTILRHWCHSGGTQGVTHCFDNKSKSLGPQTNEQVFFPFPWPRNPHTNIVNWYSLDKVWGKAKGSQSSVLEFVLEAVLKNQLPEGIANAEGKCQVLYVPLCGCCFKGWSMISLQCKKGMVTCCSTLPQQNERFKLNTYTENNQHPRLFESGTHYCSCLWDSIPCVLLKIHHVSMFWTWVKRHVHSLHTFPGLSSFVCNDWNALAYC